MCTSYINEYIHCIFLRFSKRIYMLPQKICRIINYKHESWIKSHTFPYFFSFHMKWFIHFFFCVQAMKCPRSDGGLWWPFSYSCIMKALAEGQPNDCSEDILCGTSHDMGTWIANTFLALLSIQQWWSILVLCQKCTVNNTPMNWKTWSLKNSFCQNGFPIRCLWEHLLKMQHNNSSTYYLHSCKLSMMRKAWYNSNTNGFIKMIEVIYSLQV